MERGSPKTRRDGDVVRPHRSGDVASSCFGFLAFLTFHQIALPKDRASIIALIGAGAGILLGVWLWVRRVRAEIRAAEGLPFLVPWRPRSPIMGAEPEPRAGGRLLAADAPVRPAPAISLTPRAPAPASPTRRAAAASPGRRPATEAPARPAGAAAPGRRPASEAPARPAATASPGRGLNTRVPTPEIPAVPIAGGVHAILVSGVAGPPPARAPVPAAVEDATLQILPGRLEVAAPAGRPDMRFVRQPGRATEVTLGRRADSDIGHVTLDAPTVSRLHARLRYEDGRWTIANLSRTNPVRLNGRVLPESAGPQRLGEGDRVEVGEFLLVFRER